ncbi:Protein phosphatase 2C and cyclic nucleotide-binding/kinase domain-containing protein [Acorus gramineus]|uniref:protein-serine/threonine phosphatase n=1 Tax=Acorus gramineus TaxID=55184 RepID=A0AAV9AL21_ACOGR|nr:Protein phosphatase 2C and cyclic nucleotide-binding/kinase domain-containing protein [Acorus gramineus]
MGCLYSRDCIGQAPHSNKKSSFRKNENVKAARSGSFSSSSSEDQAGENGDGLPELSTARDSDVGINRLSRVSSQFLPPEGSRTVRVPSGNYELKYSYLSQRGYYPEALDKANQDSFCIHTPFGTNPDDHFFGVFDGHGELGAQCSQFAKRKICENLLRNSKFHTDAVEACHASFLATNSQLHSDILDDSMSGTTAITVLVRGRTIIVANAGDSRAVIAEKQGSKIVAVDLSIDQTPFRSDELERVKLCGARVLTLDQIEGLKNPDVQCWGAEEGEDGDPPRLWVPNGMYPGTAFTRSIGDSIAESIGVVANPEILVLELTPNHPFFVVASDGVFEFLPSQTVVDMVTKFKEPRDACAAIVAESYRLWLQYETRTDDITVIVVHVNGLTDTDFVQEPGIVAPDPEPHVVEAVGSESPSTLSWNSKNNRVRHDLSRARVRAIESSLENGYAWVPSSSSNRKTWEEEEEGGEGKEVHRVLQRYTAENFSCFGELALMYNKPLQASVCAVTDGTLWSLKREDFRGSLMMEFTNLATLKLLRSVELLSRLTILQLSRIAETLMEISFSDGQTIIEKDECVTALYIVQKGQVRVTYDVELRRNLNASSLSSDIPTQNDSEYAEMKTEGSYFGEWALIGEHIGSLSAVAVGDVICLILMKDKFDSEVGHLAKVSQDDQKLKGYSLTSTTDVAKNDVEKFSNIQFSDLNSVLYRGVSADVLMLDRTGHLQIVDFRFGKKLTSERTFTVCGMADSLAPEVVQGKGHGFAADWWALGVLIYFMLQAEMPYGSWRESELETFARIAKGQLTLPQTLSPDAIDLMTKLLEVDETSRLGSGGAESVKTHAWFGGFDWEGIKKDNCPVPEEITSRIYSHLEKYMDDVSHLSSSPRDASELDSSEWLEDW